MYTGSDSSVQSGLLTGKAWDRTCHWIEDYKITVNNVEETISLQIVENMVIIKML